MTIETKYKIGQEVWDYKPHCELIYLVENENMNIALEERYLFPTKEELLKSL